LKPPYPEWQFDSSLVARCPCLVSASTDKFEFACGGLNVVGGRGPV